MYLNYHENTFMPKYNCGTWTFDDSTEKFGFSPQQETAETPFTVSQDEFGIKFKDSMNYIEEVIFRRRFVRPKESNDSDVITVQDVKDLVFYLAPSSALTKSLVHFFHTETMDQFLNYLIIYFEYFLKLVEYVLISRDESKVKEPCNESMKIREMLSEHLTQHRLLLAREYSKIVLGSGDMSRFHHLSNKSKTSRSIFDKSLHRKFLSFCTQIVWIAMHRRSYSTIENEIYRLVCSEHFKKSSVEFTPCERRLLYGKHDIERNPQLQRSPLIEELMNVTTNNLDILYIGYHKYRGTDARIYQLEMEYVIPESQCGFIDVAHGILGHPKNLYNSMLELDWHAVRKIDFSENYDPHRIFRQPYLEIPKWEEFIKRHKHVDAAYKFINEKYKDNILIKQRKIWKNRDKIVESMKNMKQEDFHIIEKARRVLAKTPKRIHIDVDQIIKDISN